MRLNLFSSNPAPDEADPQATPVAQPRTDQTFPADEVAWGITIRNGFDELDDPWYHRGTTQHAYLEGNDNVAICGFRPPQSGPRTRRRSRLGMPTTGVHPMCGMCARMVVAPRPRVAVPVQPARVPVAIPVSPGTPAPVAAVVAPPAAVPVATVAAPTVVPAAATSNGQRPSASVLPPPAAQPVPDAAAAAQEEAPNPPQQAQPAPTSPWVDRLASDHLDPDQGAGSGLMARDVRTKDEE